MIATRQENRLLAIVEGSIRHYLTGFLLDRESRGLARGTLEYYHNELAAFMNFLDDQGVISLDELTSGEIRKYMLQLRLRRNPGGVHASYRAIRAFLFWIEEEFEPENWKNPIRKVRPPKMNRQAREGTSKETIQALIKACDTDQARRDRLIFLVLFDTGVRAAELLALDCGDIDLVTGVVTVRHGKGDKRRSTFLGRRTRKELRAYLRTREDLFPAAPLFVTEDGDRLRYEGLRKVIHRRSEAAGVDPPGVHDFRRAFAVTMLRNGCELVQLAEMMGHASLEITRRYLKLVSDDLQRAHARSGPVDRLF